MYKKNISVAAEILIRRVALNFIFYDCKQLFRVVQMYELPYNFANEK
nr:MAG TPA: hypothetical protein [Caudoviricetes sp.]